MVDEKRAAAAIRELLLAIGEDPDREGIKETPERVARMYTELLAGYDENSAAHLKKTFPSDAKGIVLEKDIPFYSLCEHHMLPFYGKVHIAYLPEGRVAGLSKLARVTEVFARRLQLQERMTGQIADSLMYELAPRGVMVVIEAEHMCMTMRGIKKPGTKTLTIETRGAFENDEDLVRRVMEMIRYE